VLDKQIATHVQYRPIKQTKRRQGEDREGMYTKPAGNSNDNLYVKDI